MGDTAGCLRQVNEHDLEENDSSHETSYNSMKRRLADCEKTLWGVKLENAALKKGNSKLRKSQKAFMDWAVYQGWELPSHITNCLSETKGVILKAAFVNVPYGKRPAEYAFNILFFLSLPEADKLKAGVNVFHWEKSTRPETYASLKNVIQELHEFLFFFSDEDVKMEAAYGYLQRCVPKRGTS